MTEMTAEDKRIVLEFEKILDEHLELARMTSLITGQPRRYNRLVGPMTQELIAEAHKP